MTNPEFTRSFPVETPNVNQKYEASLRLSRLSLKIVTGFRTVAEIEDQYCMYDDTKVHRKLGAVSNVLLTIIKNGSEECA